MIFKRVHPYFVVTDVSNFFDSVLHSHVAEALHGLPIPTRTVGLRFFLLERLHPTGIRWFAWYSLSRGRVRLFPNACAHGPVPHDDEMGKLVGEENYVRWMDDQNMGVLSRGEGLRVLSEVGRSLARLHLSPNAQKSKVLSLSEARRHFHLDLNKLLDDADGIAKQVGARTASESTLRKKVSEIWKKAKTYEGEGSLRKS